VDSLKTNWQHNTQLKTGALQLTLASFWNWSPWRRNTLTASSYVNLQETASMKDAYHHCPIQNNNKHYCYTSMQNACTRLIQIASSDVHKYAIVTYSATMQW